MWEGLRESVGVSEMVGVDVSEIDSVVEPVGVSVKAEKQNLEVGTVMRKGRTHIDRHTISSELQTRARASTLK